MHGPTWIFWVSLLVPFLSLRYMQKHAEAGAHTGVLALVEPASAPAYFL